MKSSICLILLTLGILASPRIFAQSTLADLSGQIKAKDGTIIPGASITVRNESTGFTNRTQSNTKGHYTFKQLPLGGPYTITVSAVGFGAQKKQDYNFNQGDVVQVSFDLEQAVSNLNAVTIAATSNKKAIVNAGAATTITPTDMNRLPVNGRNFSNLAALSPLTGNGNSISGQLGSGTNYTIDGMTAKNPTSAGPTTSRSGAPYSISIEAVREFKVVTNQYDVTLGRSGGGTVSAVTKSGTNQISGSVFGFGRANWLSSPYDIRGNKRNNDYSTYQFGGSIGGPIIKDKLHYFFAWDHQTDNRSLVIADVQSPSDELLYNVTQKVLDTFVDIARTKYGVSSHAQYGSFGKRRQSDAGFLRLDWQISDKHLLTIRNNYTNDVNKLGLTDNTAISLYESTGNDFNRDNSLLLTLRSTISPKITNELKAQHLYTWQSSQQNDELPGALPRAIVENVTSVLSDGSTKATNIQIGGHRFAQEGFTNNVFQLTDNLYYNTEKINYTFGFDLMYTRAKSLYGSEVNGRYVYRGMSAFRNNTPYAFYREVPLVADPTVMSNIFNGGIYGQLQTNIGKGLNLTAGIRLDMATYPKAPLNQALYDALGLSTNNSIRSFVPQPRVQLTWDVNEKHTDYIKVGAGVFSSDINNYMLINNLTFDGKHFGTVNLNASSVTIPSPDFAAFRKNLSTVPDFAANQLPLINYTGPDVKIPIVYKANINYTKYITARLRMGVSAYLTYGRNNYFYIDKNMAADPYFSIPNEANRSVYIPLDKMNTSGGSGNYLDGRVNNAFGRVLELTSKGKNNTYTFVYDVNYRYFKDGNITASYTWNDSKDNASYNGNVANTATLSLPVANDPRDLSKMSYSDLQFRHKVVFYGTSPTFAGFIFGVRFSGIGGTRYSLLSGVNSNQDFVSGTNDLAYVFNPADAGTAPAVRDALNKLISTGADRGFREYLTKSAGKIAERNGGVNGFYGTIDLRLVKSFKVSKTGGFEFSVDVFNFANMLNKKWGASHNFGNTSLYRASAFSKDTRQYTYSVNTSGVANPGGDPYQVQLGARFFF